MPYAPVQETASVSGSGHSSVQTISPTAGNAVIVYVTQGGNGARGYVVSDDIDGATGWQQAVQLNGPTTTRAAALFYKANMPSGVTTITTTQDGTLAAFRTVAQEWSGFGTVMTRDDFSSLEESANSDNHTCSAGGVTSANPVVVFCAGVLNASATECNPGASYVEVPAAFGNAANLDQYQIFASGCSGEIGAWTSTGTDRTATSVITALSGNAAAGRTTKNTRANPLGVEVGMGWRMEP